MSRQEHRGILIEWLLKQYINALNEDYSIEIKECREIYLKQYREFQLKLKNMHSFFDYLTLKYKIRSAYLKLASMKNYDFWCSGNVQVHSSNIWLNQDLYIRTSSYGQQIKKEANFKKEFIDPFINGKFDYSFFLTNSGMSAINLAIHLSHYFNNMKPLYIQNGMYYEVYSIVRAIYKQINSIDIDNIYDLLASDTEISCIIAGYTRHKTMTNTLSVQKLLKLVSYHKQKKLLFIILDRTFFSLEDQFYSIVSTIKFPPNVVIISAESLIKHYQYGMDMVSLGGFFIYSSTHHMKIFLEVANMLYNSLSCRPSPVMCDRLFPFNESILKKQFTIAKENAKLMQQALDDFPIIPIDMIHNTCVSTADVLYLPVRNYEIGELAIAKIIESQLFVRGQSFGFDITRLNCERDEISRDTYIRISVGTEDEIELKQKCIHLRNILRNICAKTGSFKS